MNRRSLFRLFGLGIAASIVPLSAARYPSPTDHTHSVLVTVGGRVVTRSYHYSRESAERYARLPFHLDHAIVSVFVAT